MKNNGFHGSDLVEKGSNLSTRLLTREEFYGLAEIPPEGEWFADIQNENTRRAYWNDVKEFRRFIGIGEVIEFRIVTRAHVLAWRKELERRWLASSTIRRKLSALSSLFAALCDANAIEQNPVSGVSRPKQKSIQTPALSDDQVKAYLDAPDPFSKKSFSRKLKAHRDRAILSVLAFHGLRCSEVTGLQMKDIREERGVKVFTVHGKGSKIRYVPVHPHTLDRIATYLEFTGQGDDREAFLFPSSRTPGKRLSREAVFQNIVRKYARQCRVDPREVCTHSFRVTSATNAEENGGDLKEIQQWMGHSSIATTEGYARARIKIADSPTYKVRY